MGRPLYHCAAMLNIYQNLLCCCWFVFFSTRPKRYKTYAYLIAWNDKFNKEHKLLPKKTGHNADSLGNVLAYSRGEPKCGLVISHQTKKPKARCNGRYLFNQLLFCSFFFNPSSNFQCFL